MTIVGEAIVVWTATGLSVITMKVAYVLFAFL
ncbi:Uncharacterised protein [Streptococcus pneumoniae]|nr:Uncharacterised protein [Streptococcus pneumoniae]